MSTYTELLDRIASDWQLLKAIPPAKINEDIALASLTHSARPLTDNVIPRHMVTEEFLQKAIRNNPCLIDAVDNAKMTSGLINEVIRHGGHFLKKLPQELIDVDVAMMAVMHDGENLQYLERDVKIREVCLAAVQSSPLSLKWVPRDIITYEIAYESVTRDGMALAFVPVKLQDHALIMQAVGHQGNALQFVPEKEQTHNMVMLAVNQNCWAIRYVRPNLQSLSVMITAVKEDGSILSLIKQDEQTVELVAAAVSRSPGAIRMANPEFISESIALDVILRDPALIKYVPRPVQTRKILTEFILDDIGNINHLGHHSLLGRVDLLQWASSRSYRSEKGARQDKSEQLLELINEKLGTKTDIEHLSSASKPETDSLDRLLHLSQIKPFTYTKVGRLCAASGQKPLLRELFGETIAKRFFSPRKKRKVLLPISLRWD